MIPRLNPALLTEEAEIQLYCWVRWFQCRLGYPERLPCIEGKLFG